LLDLRSRRWPCEMRWNGLQGRGYGSILTGVYDSAILVKMAERNEEIANETFNNPDRDSLMRAEKLFPGSLQVEGKRFGNDTEMFGGGTRKREFVTIHGSWPFCRIKRFDR
jgi:hypothetical protein